MLKLFVVAVAVATITADLESQWAVFKDKFAKIYDSPEVETARKYIWIENKKKIESHNKLYAKGLSSYYQGENQFTDMTTSEFVSKMSGLNVKVGYQPDKYVQSNTSLPDTLDWRTEGYVTRVKDQKQCSSCWAFSATGSMEGQHFKATGQLVSLSESNLIDCSTMYGCTLGGNTMEAFQYVISNNGIDTEEYYPYRPVDGECRFSDRHVGAKFSSFQRIYPGSETALLEATAEIGPISVAINSDLMQFYTGGVFDDPRCDRTNLDHSVLVVGYGTVNSNEYWIVKNSWGSSWGMEGYILMSRNKDNQCGIASYASYPIV